MAKRLGFPFNRMEKRTKVEESSPSPLSSLPPLPFPSVSISQPSAAASKSPEEGEAAGDAELLFMFFCYTFGPIAYSLYAVDAPSCSSKPESSSSCDHHHQVRKPDDTPLTIYPILEFPWGEYPDGMFCVELESKLYFLGGLPDKDQKVPLSRDVYVLDAATAAACASSSRINQKGPSEELLKKGTPMNTGKPDPYVFVAYGRIYVIVDAHLIYHDYKDISWFEVFDPDTDQWLTMPDPPINVGLVGHAVVDRNVFLVGMDNSVFYFNLDTGVWVRFSKYSRLSLSPYDSRAEFVQDTLYACYKKTIVAFDGPCSSEADQGHHDDKPEGLFYHKAFLSPEMLEALYDGKYYAHHSSPYLVSYGNRTFCYVLASSLQDPNNPIYLEDSDRFHIRLTVFKALKGTYTNFVYGEETTYFRANLLRSADYVARSRCGAPAPSALLQGCFSVPLVQGRRNEIKR